MNSHSPRPGDDPDRPLDHQAPDQPRESRVRQTEPVNDAPDQPGTVDTDASRVREPDQGINDPIRFDGPRNAPSRETESVAPAPTLATGMFLPVVILVIVAVILILVFVL